MSSLARVVMMVHEMTGSPCGSCHVSQRPAKANGSPRCQRDAHRSNGGATAPPFVEAVGGDQAAPLRQGGAEAWPLGDRLGPCIDHRSTRRRTPRPGRDQSPPHVRGVPALPAPHGEHHLGGRDVVPDSLRQTMSVELEPYGELSYLCDEAISSAHVGVPGYSLDGLCETDRSRANAPIHPRDCRIPALQSGRVYPGICQLSQPCATLPLGSRWPSSRSSATALRVKRCCAFGRVPSRERRDGERVRPQPPCKLAP